MFVVLHNAVVQLVEAVSCKSEGQGLDSNGDLIIPAEL
jgi:hypothetical protein